jgi:hypothetical protein
MTINDNDQGGEHTGKKATKVAAATPPRHLLLPSNHTGRAPSTLPSSTRTGHRAQEKCPAQMQFMLWQRQARIHLDTRDEYWNGG